MDSKTPDNDRDGILVLGFLSLVAGAATGLVGACFRICLDRAVPAHGALLL